MNQIQADLEKHHLIREGGLTFCNSITGSRRGSREYPFTCQNPAARCCTPLITGVRGIRSDCTQSKNKGNRNRLPGIELTTSSYASPPPGDGWSYARPDAGLFGKRSSYEPRVGSTDENEH